MSNVERIYFLGYSGHAYVAIEVAKANGWTILGYFDKAKCKNNPFSIDYCGDENDFGFKDKIKDAVVFPAIGSNTIRKKIHKNIFNENIRQTVLIAPSASVSNSAMIGESTLVSSNAVINSFAKIGKCCIINTGAIIEHECVTNSVSKPICFLRERTKHLSHIHQAFIVEKRAFGERDS